MLIFWPGTSHPPKISRLGGTHDSTDYGCCGPVNTTNRDGSILTHRLDPLNRPSATTYASVTTSNVYDSAGNLLAQLRIGTNGSVTTQVTNTNGIDRIAQSTAVAANWSSQDSQITRSYVWSTNKSAASNLVSESRKGVGQ